MTDMTNDGNKWALLIGINEYAHTPDLRGSVNDAMLIRSILLDKHGFSPKQIRLLLDAHATRSNILDGLNWLLEQTTENDVVVMHYSGHGTPIVDATGKSLNEWVSAIVPSDTTISFQQDRSGRVSAIMPSDTAISSQQDTSLITYYEIYEWLTELTKKTPNVTLLFDCDHAGTISTVLGLEPQAKAQYVFIGGCRENERAVEYLTEGGYQGAFTYLLGQALLNATADTSYRDMFERVSAQSAARFGQRPQIEGDIDRVLFGVGKTESMHFVAVAERTERKIILSAGAVRGMTARSRWTIYPQETDQVTSKTPRVGLVKITAVRAAQSEAIILSESDDQAIVPGTKAIEEMHYYGEMRLVVDLQVPDGFGDAKEELVGLLERSELLRVADPDDHAHVTAHTVLPGTEFGEDDPLHKLGPVVEPTWAVLDESGKFVMQPYSAENRSSPWALRDNLEKLARFRNVLGLSNANINSSLFGKVDLILLRQAMDGNWVEAEPEAQSGMVVFSDGEQIAFRIVNHHSVPVQVTVLDLGLTANIYQLYPIPGDKETIAPGGSVEVGVREGDEIEIYMPDGFPFVPDPSEVETSVGIDTFKLFATTYETDFSSLLVQEGYRSISKQIGETTILWQLLDMAMTGWGSRNVRQLDSPMEQDWTTVERTFALQRGEGR